MSLCRLSQGFAIKKLVFNDKYQLVNSRVCRQFTTEEKETLLDDSSHCSPEDVEARILTNPDKPPMQQVCYSRS